MVAGGIQSTESWTYNLIDLTEACSQGDFQHNLLHISEPQFSQIHNKNNKT